VEDSIDFIQKPFGLTFSLPLDDLTEAMWNDIQDGTVLIVFSIAHLPRPQALSL